MTGVFIVFLLDTKNNQHDGKTFLKIKEAREYVKENIDDLYYDKAIIGFSVLSINTRETSITEIETYGFKNSKKKVEQLRLFN